MEETIRTYSGQIIGYIKTLSNGDKEVRNFTGQIVYRGDMSAALLVIRV